MNKSSIYPKIYEVGLKGNDNSGLLHFLYHIQSLSEYLYNYQDENKWINQMDFNVKFNNLVKKIRIKFIIGHRGQDGNIYIVNSSIPRFPYVLTKLIEIKDKNYLNSCIILENYLSKIHFKYPIKDVMKLNITSYSIDTDENMCLDPPILHLFRKLTKQNVSFSN